MKQILILLVKSRHQIMNTQIVTQAILKVVNHLKLDIKAR